MTKITAGAPTQKNATTTSVSVQKNYDAKLKARLEMQAKLDEEKATAKAEKEAKSKKPGVIQTIHDTIVNAKKPVTAEEVLDVLSEAFPNRDASSMANTVKAQIGGKKALCRMEREKNIIFDVTITKSGARAFSFEA